MLAADIAAVPSISLDAPGASSLLSRGFFLPHFATQTKT